MIQVKTRLSLWLLVGCSLLHTWALRAQIFTAGHLAVLRVGNGTQTLANSGNSVFIDQFTEAGVLMNVNVLPDTGAQALLQSGTAGSEGGLTRSLDHSQLVLAGYNVSRGSISGSLSSQSAAVVPRAVATIDAFLNYQLFQGGPSLYSSNNIRGAASDGTNNFWTAGSPGGTFYLQPPQGPIEIQPANANTRQVKIIGGNLYFSTQAGTAGIYTFAGGGLPTSSNSPVLLIATGANSQPAGFSLNVQVTTAYVADQRSSAGGIQKWTNNGSAWALAYSFSTGAGAFDVTATFNGSSPVIFATTAESSGNRLISITDTGPLSIVKVLSTAGVNQVYRGLDFVPDLRPVIVSQPQNQTVATGTDASFSVQAQSHYPLSYQWQKNNAEIAGATDSTFILQNVSSADQAAYRVVVTNLYGSITSASANLMVNQAITPPTITSQPVSQTVALSGNATLSVIANGTPPLMYQWELNGIDLPGQTNSSLFLVDAGPADQGDYLVTITNSAGSTNSQPAFITIATPPASFAAYTAAGLVYSQNFDSLPDPGTTSVNADNPVKIGSTSYALANPFDFTFPILPNSVDPGTGIGLGGLGLSNSMPGWYALGVVEPKFGANAGDQSTGGVISFGLTNSLNVSSNRALGLLATSSTGPTAFALKLVNQTAQTLGKITIQFTGELWRQSAAPKTLSFGYWIDPTASNILSTNITARLAGLDVTFAPDPTATDPVPVDGTSPLSQVNLGTTDQAIADWPPGGALWLIWQMDDALARGQGLAIDNFVFSATSAQTGNNPQLSIRQSGGSIVISWPAALSGYQLQGNSDLSATAGWSTVAQPVVVANGLNTVTIPIGGTAQFYRLKQ